MTDKKNDYRKVTATLRHGAVFHKREWLFTWLMLFLFLTSPTISLIGCFPALIGIRPFDDGEIACLIGTSCVGVPMAALIVYVLITKHRLKKKIYRWMEDAVSLYAESFAVSRIRFVLAWHSETKLKLIFHYKKEKIVLYSGDPAKNYHILKANGYYRVLEKYSDRKVDILYSPKYNEVMFV